MRGRAVPVKGQFGFRFYPINYGAINRPLGQRRKRIVPEGVDPTTGEILEPSRVRKASDFVLSQAIGKKLSPPQREAQRGQTLRVPKVSTTFELVLCFVAFFAVCIILAFIIFGGNLVPDYKSDSTPYVPPDWQQDYYAGK